MSFAKLLTLIVLHWFMITEAKTQYSPYFFVDTLKDEGITSVKHFKLRGKIDWKASDDNIDKKSFLKKDSVIEIQASSTLNAKIYLAHSLRYYYNKYAFDTGQQQEDWDYTRNKSDREIISDDFENQFGGYFVFVLTNETDTIASWKTSVSQQKFKNETVLELQLWEERLDLMADADNYSPLFSYMYEKNKAANYTINLSVYAGKINCHSVKDRGPEILSQGKFRINITNEDLKKIKAVKNESFKRKFMDIDFEGEQTWGVKTE